MATPQAPDPVAQVLEKAWADQDFENRLVSDPKAVLQENGVSYPAETHVEVLQSNTAELNLAIPLKTSPLLAVTEQIPMVKQIIDRAWQDSAFKDKLLAEPKAAIAEATGVTLPDAMKVNVVESTATHEYFVLGPNPHGPRSGELSDAELELVVGGKGPGDFGTPGPGGNVPSPTVSSGPVGGSPKSGFGGAPPTSIAPVGSGLSQGSGGFSGGLNRK